MEYAIVLTLLLAWEVFTKLWFLVLAPLWIHIGILVARKQKRFPTLGLVLSLVLTLFVGFWVATTVN